jgi:hypothetical protein
MPKSSHWLTPKPSLIRRCRGSEYKALNVHIYRNVDEIYDVDGVEEDVKSSPS